MSDDLCPDCGSKGGPDHPCPAPYLGRTLDGRYALESLLGKGGMGMVFRATQTSMRRPIAVKTLNPSLAVSPQFFERFRREAEVASQLRHPNIVTVLDFGRDADGTCFIAMELLEGESLRQIVRRDGPMTLRRALDVTEQAARALSHAHKEGIVHRDIKPQNLQLSQVDGRDHVTVLDFGLVKAMEDEEEEALTSTGQVLGTPQYMAPEQAGGEPVDARSDLYSLAAVFFFCLTGGSPYGASSIRKALMAALNEPLPKVGSRRQGAPVPRSVDEVLRQAMAADREHRHPSVAAFIDDLYAGLEGVEDAVLDALPEGGQRAPEATSTSASRRLRRRRPQPVRSSGPTERLDEAPALGAASQRSTAPEIPSLRGATGSSDTGSSRSSSPPPVRRRLRLGKPFYAGLGAGAVVLALVTGLTLVNREASADGHAVAANVTDDAAATLPDDAAATLFDDAAVLPDAAAAERQALPAAVSVTLTSEPPGAEVVRGQELLGVTPLQLELTRDRLHPLLFRRDGYEELARSLDFTLVEAARYELAVALERSAAAQPPRPRTRAIVEREQPARPRPARPKPAQQAAPADTLEIPIFE